MPFEIELKARLDDFEPVKERLSTLGAYSRSYKKSDTYWLSHTSLAPSDVRVRRESGINADGSAHEAVLATYKTKEITGGIEINEENEFAVSDAGIFEALLSRLGLHRGICKEKEGWAWTIPPKKQPGEEPILAELSQVSGLGWFLELEIIAAANDSETFKESRSRLLALLAHLEIPAGKIEAKPYTQMLRETGVTAFHTAELHRTHIPV